jgi:hypothetical protein
MARAGGYVLHLDTDRRSVFKSTVEEHETFSEPVRDFDHARSAPLICFVVLDGRRITHIAGGRRGIVAGTGLRRLNLQAPHQLKTPIPLDDVVAALPSRTRARASAVLREGGFFTPKAFDYAVEAISSLSGEAGPLLQKFSRQRRELIARISPEARRALGEQKEVLLAAILIAGLDRREIYGWEPPTEGQPKSFLEGLTAAVVREDAMIVNDMNTVPGFDLVRRLPHGAAVFEGEGKRLTVVLANRLPLEQLTGTDLIYYNETYRSFVMVQYKAMEHVDGVAFFRIPNANLDQEVDRMQAITRQIVSVDVQATKENYRLSPGPFFIKLCSRTQFNPDDIKLFPGMYFALDHWLCLASDMALVGRRGGHRVTYENAGRYIDNGLFIALVAQAWIGTPSEHSSVLERAIRETVESGRAVALAVESRSKPATDGEA